jgi:hypothetical protein
LYKDLIEKINKNNIYDDLSGQFQFYNLNEFAHPIALHTINNEIKYFTEIQPGDKEVLKHF